MKKPKNERAFFCERISKKGIEKSLEIIKRKKSKAPENETQKKEKNI